MCKPEEMDEATRRARADAAMARYATTGDKAAFHELYCLTYERLYGFLYRMVGLPRARDVMQDTYSRMIKARGTYRIGAPVFPWMYAIANRLAIDCLRQAQREVSIETEEGRKVEEQVYADGGADEMLVARGLSVAIEAALRALSENERSVFELVDGEGLTYKEAAEALGKTVSSVTASLNRARVALRAAHAAYDKGEES